jgi:hypothetical protein
MWHTETSPQTLHRRWIANWRGTGCRGESASQCLPLSSLPWTGMSPAPVLPSNINVANDWPCCLSRYTTEQLYAVGRQKNRGSITGRDRDISVHRAQTNYWDRSLSHPMGSKRSYSGVNSSRHETDHSLPSIVETKILWSYISAALYAFMLL